ncbi:UNVERIFIED_CONTAM: hypothetical protein HDU68_001652 [Siphonaria sp. JEL0065]|nr:hypothetical protein HDU68_001652 [Siphonaria sp. JEL0065]
MPPPPQPRHPQESSSQNQLAILAATREGLQPSTSLITTTTDFLNPSTTTTTTTAPSPWATQTVIIIYASAGAFLLLLLILAGFLWKRKYKRAKPIGLDTLQRGGLQRTNAVGNNNSPLQDGLEFVPGVGDKNPVVTTHCDREEWDTNINKREPGSEFFLMAQGVGGYESGSSRMLVPPPPLLPQRVPWSVVANPTDSRRFQQHESGVAVNPDRHWEWQPQQHIHAQHQQLFLHQQIHQQPPQQHQHVFHVPQMRQEFPHPQNQWISHQNSIQYYHDPMISISPSFVYPPPLPPFPPPLQSFSQYGPVVQADSTIPMPPILPPPPPKCPPLQHDASKYFESLKKT